MEDTKLIAEFIPIGTRVRIIGNGMDEYAGDIGTVERHKVLGCWPDHLVRFTNGNGRWYAGIDRLIVVK